MPVVLKAVLTETLPLDALQCRRCWSRRSVLVGPPERPVVRCARCGFLFPKEPQAARVVTQVPRLGGEAADP